MKTEGEARQCWCPMARPGAVAEAHFPNNRSAGYNCIASQCMAWKWRGGVAPDAYGAVVSGDGTKSVQVGFCGLAGDPR